ncbi:copper resistance system multicopper oxidase [Pikeienuella sp. HZG-20]|uniref:copper resistance system multicopper oxidase n=1 Tax=Paludibacillus litoralis TaxID=3133267 RepID=UPI0030EB9603
MTSGPMRRAVAFGIATGLAFTGAASAGTYDITVDRVTIDTGDFTKTGIGYNGSAEPKVLRFKEGEDVVINVTNNLSESTSIHWHGIILPFEQDGVPGISFNGIAPGETFTYRIPIRQSGTYWFHSHTGLQEPDGAYGALILEPSAREPYRYDREYVVQLTDTHPHSGERVMRNLKQMPDYYNRKQRTLIDFFADAGENGVAETLADRAQWGEMRMMPTDIEDVQGVSPLINGRGASTPWTGRFDPGERIRLRFINSSAMTYFDIRIPGMDMTVVQADGNDVAPVKVEEFRIAVAETYDVIVRPREEGAFNIIAESMGRTTMARGVLASAAGLTPPAPPPLRADPLLTMADMALDPMMAGMHDGMEMPGETPAEMSDGGMAGMDHSAMGAMKDDELPPGAHRMPDGSIMGGPSDDPFYANGSGLTPTAAEGGKFLSYMDLKAQSPLFPDREATREIEIRLTGNMERYIWSINGVKYEDADPIVLQYGERVRFKFVNETMMAHPMHLHGMWSIVDTGSGVRDPIKHTISVAPGTIVYTETEVDAPGQWAFHCHLSYHMAGGMFRKVIVEGGPEAKPAPAPAALRG